MIPFVTIQGRKFDTIEQFDDYLVVQDLITKKIYSVKVCFLDFAPTFDDTVDEESKIVNMFWYKMDQKIKEDKKNGQKEKS
jgi:hypothetical protein